MELLPIQKFRVISKAVYGKYYDDLGKIEIAEDSTLEDIKISAIPREGIHAKVKYTMTLKFQEEGSWPLVFIDSEIFDRIKTVQYVLNVGKTGSHKGICIKNMSYGYNFNKNFKQLCDNKWENYIYYLITVFNNLETFEKGNGIRANYKKILGIEV